MFKGFLYAIGGYDGSHCHNSAERMDLISGKWELIPSMLNKRVNLAAVSLNQHIYAIGNLIKTNVLIS